MPWNVPIIRAKQTQSSPGMSHRISPRNLQSVQRASCRKNHTQSCPCPCSFPVPAPIPYSIPTPHQSLQSHTQSTQISKGEATASASASSGLKWEPTPLPLSPPSTPPCQRAIFLRISRERPRPDKPQQLVEHHTPLVVEPFRATFPPLFPVSVRFKFC